MSLPVFQGTLGATIASRIDKMIENGGVKPVDTAKVLPHGVPEMSIEDAEKRYGKKKVYTQWWFWALLGAGVVGTGLIIYSRRRKRRR